ncbi:DNA recombination protein RmuC [endosymbiont of Lamellibrachia barhami]|uniref:DNA recombination protein RmuC n=1 Tax=endosymbiont of Lamellibrachia barhami TaxID=205975 RepID=UPI0015A7D445|nr:DNA recombination protein RmuC [endosymbiont of Lamellibrachia barhami]
METLLQLPSWQQAALAISLLLISMLFMVLRWLWKILEHQLVLAQTQEGRHRQSDERLREQERVLLRELSQTSQDLGDRIAKGAMAQQRSLHVLQQQMLERSDKLYQGLERRFGEMQQTLTGDAGRLRVELLERFEQLQTTVASSLHGGRLAQHEKLMELKEALSQSLVSHRQAFDERQLDAMKAQQEALHNGMTEVRKQVGEALIQHADDLGKRVQALAETTDQRLKEISGQVEKRLNEGFEKTTETFSKVLIHLTRIDEAQKKITELSSNVVSLQEILSDKRSRGAFGEVQLNALVRNVMPESGFSLQHTLGNGKRADCMLFLPDPTGNVVIDAKFPLEAYQRMQDTALSEADRNQAKRQFRQDIRKHIDDIASKYIIAGETADGAVMFIPAEAVFAEIHAHFPDLVEDAYRKRVWLVSPTTMMAVLTTARAVLKDAATREQVHVIQRHLQALSKDFGRFQERMDKLAVHIDLANRDVNDVNISAKKISRRFQKIEKVELEEEQGPDLPVFKESLPGNGTESETG